MNVLALWDFADPAGSAARFTAAAAAAPDEPTRQTLLTQLARAHGLAGDYAAGHAVLDKLGDAEAEAEPGVRALLERGRLLRSAGDPQAATPLFRDAYFAAATHELYGLAADAAHMMALVTSETEHEEWTQRGLAIADGSDDPLALSMTGALLNNRAWALADSGDWQAAYPLFDRAVTARQAALSHVDGPAQQAALHAARWCRARAARALGDMDAARAEQLALAATPLGSADPYVAEELALLT